MTAPKVSQPSYFTQFTNFLTDNRLSNWGCDLAGRVYSSGCAYGNQAKNHKFVKPIYDPIAGVASLCFNKAAEHYPNCAKFDLKSRNFYIGAAALAFALVTLKKARAKA